MNKNEIKRTWTEKEKKKRGGDLHVTLDCANRWQCRVTLVSPKSMEDMNLLCQTHDIHGGQSIET